MPKTTQLTLTLESKPGVLAKISRALAGAGVNITAICAAEAAGRGKIRMVVSDAARAKEALKAAKLRCGEEQALTLTLEDRPGALARVAEKLAAAKINIKCAYATGGGMGGTTTVVLTVSNADKAAALLGV
ncbi:MAG: ACT domain-containing protein [Candidatus Rokubacteria bacterium]|nr:ACT domain-containing protein [Candidatus Rokubacteria bacterium]MBI2555355.1 ACT domain-containing protein [Candidatus Rokubacteria bacterium]